MRNKEGSGKKGRRIRKFPGKRRPNTVSFKEIRIYKLYPKNKHGFVQGAKEKLQVLNQQITGVNHKATKIEFMRERVSFVTVVTPTSRIVLDT